MSKYIAIRVNRNWKHFEECFTLWNKILPEDSTIVETFELKPYIQNQEIIIYGAESFRDVDFNQAPFHPCDVYLYINIYLQRENGRYNHKYSTSPKITDARYFYQSLAAQTTQHIIKKYFSFDDVTIAKRNPFTTMRILPPTNLYMNMTAQFPIKKSSDGKISIEEISIFNKYFPSIQGTYDPGTKQFYLADTNGESGRLALIESGAGSISEISTGAVSLEEKVEE
ncbi:MAG: hypothetical protein Q8R37_00120 [Nanoarchaeota archaeon]|nr:hypothetical protein [Nanoarchaeota archaeon]